MKLQINIDTEFDMPADLLRAASAFVALAGERGPTAVGLPARGFTSEQTSTPVEQKPEPASEPVKQTRAPRQTKAAEQPAPTEPTPEPTPAPTEQPAQTVAITREQIGAAGQEVTKVHGAPSIAAVGDLFKTYLNAEGTAARLSTVQEKDFPDIMAKLKGALAKPAGTPVDQLFA